MGLSSRFTGLGDHLLEHELHALGIEHPLLRAGSPVAVELRRRIVFPRLVPEGAFFRRASEGAQEDEDEE